MSSDQLTNPLLPLTSAEIRTAANLIQNQFPPSIPLHFKAITLEEPDKQDVLAFFAAQREGMVAPHVDRLAFVCYYIRDSAELYDAIVSLSENKVIRHTRLGPEFHGALDPAEMELIADKALNDEQVKAAIAKLELPAGSVVIAEPWMYGSEQGGDPRRLYQCFLFMRDPNNSSEPDSNHYAFPLPFSPVMDAVTKKIVRIDHIPTGSDEKTEEIKPWKPAPPNEYIPEAQKSLRQDVKPLHISQPEGVSFKITPLGETGHRVQWQKWDFQVGFNQREGMVLYNVTYDARSLFYRISLSEMNVPYGDPRAPFHRKAAFDLGDAGAGATANNLKLGCDCLGSIQYLDGLIADDQGCPVTMENCVCVHEQDGGIGWKHTNWRTGRAAVVRNRELVLQSILTLANYEYILAFMFNQAGELIYEVRATGILSTQPIDEDVSVPFGTVVHPGVLAAYHQHIFSLRIDPAIDGYRNCVAYDEVYPMPRDPKLNPHGVGYISKETVVDISGGYDLDYKVNRTFKIMNNEVKNPVNKKSVGYKIHVPPIQAMLADEDSLHYKRAEFADHAIYVTKYEQGEMYAGGKYTNQSKGGTGVRTWANRKDNVKDTDIVVWVQFGLQHIPRIEDFPVMPCEVIKVALKPVNFFTRNPAMDVPPSQQEVNKSVLVSGEHQNGTRYTNGTACHC